MKRQLVSSILAFIVCGAIGQGVARAERLPPSGKFPRVFDDAPVKGRALWAIRAVEKNCEYSEMERSGPSPAEERRCSRAESNLVSLGPKGLAPVLATLDDEDLQGGARVHLYDAVARFHDLTAVAPLVRALDRIGGPGGEMREWEVEHIELALENLTFAKVGDMVPWDTSGVQEPAVAAREWKDWLAKHPTLNEEDLFAERLNQDRAHMHDTDFWQAFLYSSFFAEHAAGREEAIIALRGLQAREGLEEDEERTVRQKLGEVTRAARKEKAKARQRKREPVADPKAPTATPNV